MHFCLPELQKLHSEREDKQLSQDRLSGSNDSINSVGKKSADASPFKFFQENLLDKMKNIPKPAVIKDKIQEKFNLDLKMDQKPISKGYVVSDKEATLPEDQTDSSPLPPVVQLISPSLISVEVALPPVKNNIDISKNTDVFTKRGEGVVVENTEQRTEVSDYNNESPQPVTGSGPASALARLQEDQREEENSKPVYQFAPQTDTGPMTFDEKLVLPSFSSIADDDIVFSRKAKTKNKKKKTGKHRSC